MKRPIIFRGKRKSDGTIIQGSLIDNGSKSNTFFILADDITYFGEIEEVYPETICQNTGILDISNNEIFEGDSINVWNWGKGEELICTAKVVWDSQEHGWNWETENTLPFDIDNYDRWRTIEIIKN